MTEFLTRRAVVGGALASVFQLPACLAGAAPEAGLGERARKKGLFYGCAVQRRHIESDPAFKEAVLAECTLIVPEWEMKWRAVERTQGVVDFGDADWLVGFAKNNALEIRGHNVVWGGRLPAWANSVTLSPKDPNTLLTHVYDFARHFKGQLINVDVVNEAIDPSKPLNRFMRRSLLTDVYSTEYIADSFSAYRRIDPSCKLYYNDYGVDYGNASSVIRRKAVLNLLRDLKKRNIPIDGLGIQGHLNTTRKFEAKSFSAFLSAVAELGIEIAVTEFDVADYRHIDSEKRLGEITKVAEDYLGTLFDQKAVVGLITWGLSNKYSWLNENKKFGRRDGAGFLGLPLDRDMRRTRLWRTLAEAIDGASPR